MTNRIYDRAVNLLEVSRSGSTRPAAFEATLAEFSGDAGNSLEEEQIELLDAIAASMGEPAQEAPPRIRQAAITALLEQICVLPRVDRAHTGQEEAFSSWMRNNRLAPSLRT